jgi:hypothetical protein
VLRRVALHVGINGLGHDPEASVDLSRALRGSTLDGQTRAQRDLAIQRAVTDSWKEPLEDDGTVVVMAIG